MANGDITLLDRSKLSVKLLDAELLDNDGVWIEARFYPLKAIWRDAIETAGAVEIHASNADALPANSVDGIILATLTPTVLGMTDNHGWRWIKAKKAEGTVPAATTVIMEANHGN